MHIGLNFFRQPGATVSYDSLKRSVQRARAYKLPQNVIDVAAINDAFSRPETMATYGMTKANKVFFKTAYECAAFSYCVFASDDIIERFQERIPKDRRHFLMDATFKICPFGVFNQILIIYVSYVDRVCGYFIYCVRLDYYMDVFFYFFTAHRAIYLCADVV